MKYLVLGFLAVSSSTFATESFQEFHFEEVRSFQTVDLSANVIVETVPEDTGVAEVRISTSGNLQDVISSLEISNAEGLLTIKDKSQRTQNNGNFLGLGNVKIKNLGPVVLSRKPENNLPVIRVKLPLSTPLRLCASDGRWTIGNTNGAFCAILGDGCEMRCASINGDTEIKIVGSGDFKAEAVNAQCLTSLTKGSGDITIRSLNIQTAKLKIAGSGDVGIKGGQMCATLSAKIDGSGDIKFMCPARDANLKIAGSGEIKVFSVEGELSRKVSGSGKIKVGNRIQDRPKKESGVRSNLTVSCDCSLVGFFAVGLAGVAVAAFYVVSYV